MDSAPDSRPRDRLVGVCCGIAAWVVASLLLVSRLPRDVVLEGLTPRLVALLFLVVFLMPVGWALHWAVRAGLARRHGYAYRPRLRGTGLFRWLD